MEKRAVVPVTAPHRGAIPAFLGMILFQCHPYHPLVRISAYPPVCCLCQLCPRQVSSLCVIVGHPGHHFFRHWWAACTPPMTTACQ